MGVRTLHAESNGTGMSKKKQGIDTTIVQAGRDTIADVEEDRKLRR